jgi:membrane-associated phospholipid phosphatase
MRAMWTEPYIAAAHGQSADNPRSRLARFFINRFGPDLHVRPCRRLPAFVAAALLLGGAFVALMVADSPLTAWVDRVGLDDFMHRNLTWARAIRLPGNFLFIIPIAFLLWWFHPWRSQAPALLMWASLIAGSNWILKWLIGRPRPDHRGGVAAMDFDPMPGGLAGLFHDKSHSMPSGDAALAFAVAATLAWLLPRWRVPMYAWAAIVALERVAENAHHLSDVLAGAAVGLLSFQIGHFAATLAGAWTARIFGIDRAPPASDVSSH